MKPIKKKVDDHEEIVSLMLALGNTTRLRIVLDLALGEKCVCKIFERLKLPQNLVSHHLGILREKGVICARRSGKWVYYSLEEKSLTTVSEMFQGILDSTKHSSAC